MSALQDYEMDRIQKSWSATDKSGANAAVTVTKSTPRATDHNVIVKVDASFSNILGTGLLTVKEGSRIVGEKYIHGAGALDFSEFGKENTTAGEDVSATLSAGGSGYIGCVTMVGYTTGSRADD